MSDHWNSIANLLKTPSLNPTTKKTDGPPKPAKSTPSVEPVVRIEESQAPPVEPPKSKPEPSRLRSSWDAVATFFGVAAPEHQPEAEANTSTLSDAADTSVAPKALSSSKKSKPSMWGESSEEPSRPASIERPAVERPTSLFEEKTETARDSEFPRARSRGRDRSPRPVDAERGELPISEPASRRLPSSDRSDEPKTLDSERRSLRQQPRRGRQADVRADVAFGEQDFVPDEIIDDAEVSEPAFRERDESPRGDAPRPPRGRGNRSSSEGQRETKPDRGPRPEHAARDDRPPRPQAEGRTGRPPRPIREEGYEREASSDRPERRPRSEGQPRPAREESSGLERPSRPERGDRPPRADRPERAPRAAGTDRSDRPARAEGARTERTSRPERPSRSESGERPPRAERSERPAASRVDRSNRDAPSDRRPSTSNPPKKTSGFGAGIHDDDSFADDSFAFVDDRIDSTDDFDFVQDSSAPEANDEPVSEDDRESRPRRRRGRGRRNGPRTSDSEASADVRSIDDDRNEVDDDSNDFISKNSRIPSWQETIGTLVTVNMENHQRNQSSNRPPRGRGPRRDR